VYYSGDADLTGVAACQVGFFDFVTLVVTFGGRLECTMEPLSPIGTK
jgi:hypothetical protein